MSPRRRTADTTWADAWMRADATRHAYWLPELQSANVIWRHVGGRTLTSRAHRQDQANARLVFARATPLEGRLAVTVQWHQRGRRGDVDNRLKPTLDVLRGIAYADDAQVDDARIVRVVVPADQPTGMAVAVEVIA